MKFSTKEDLEVPIEAVFAAVTDFETFERRAMRRGADVQRVEEKSPPAAGMAWDVSFQFRGKVRRLAPRLETYTVPTALAISSDTGGLNMLMDISLVRLSPKRTRLAVSLDLKPSTLSARLLVQSLKLAKSSLNTRFKASVEDFAAGIERDHNGVRVG